MNLRLVALAAMSVLASACVTAIPTHQPLPPDARSMFGATDVMIPVAQSEIQIAVPASSIAAAGGGGLLLALIDAGVDSNNAATAEEAIKPLRSALVDFDFDEQMRSQVQSALDQSAWLHAGNYKVVKEVTNENLDNALAASSASGVLFVTTSYNLNWSGDTVTIKSNPHLYPKSSELVAMVLEPTDSGPRTSSVNAIYRNMLTYRDRAPGVTDVRETNMEIWEKDSGAAMRLTLASGAAKIAQILSKDLHEPLAPIDEKTTTLSKITIDGLPGYVASTDDNGTLVQFIDGTLMYITKAALAELPRGAPPAQKAK
jgi:hypothetical protein